MSNAALQKNSQSYFSTTDETKSVTNHKRATEYCDSKAKGHAIRRIYRMGYAVFVDDDADGVGAGGGGEGADADPGAKSMEPILKRV